MTFPRVLYWDDKTNKNKYVFLKEYKGWGIYQRKVNDCFVMQEYLIMHEDTKIVIQSYNNYIEEEILDMIDAEVEHNKMNVKVFFRDGFYIVHDGGDMVI